MTSPNADWPSFDAAFPSQTTPWPQASRLPPDLDKSWDMWALSAEQTGEIALGLALRQTKPGAPTSLDANTSAVLDDGESSAVTSAGPTVSTAAVKAFDNANSAWIAADLTVLRRPAEAIAVLQSAGVEPSKQVMPQTLTELVLGAAHAAQGNDDAWTWFQSVQAGLSTDLRAHLLPLYQAVAQTRAENAPDSVQRQQDQELADKFTSDLLDRHGPQHTPSWENAATIELLQRSSTANATAQGELFLRTARTAGSLSSDLTGPAKRTPRHAIAVAEALTRRGDQAAGRLLLIAFEYLYGSSSELKAARKRLDRRLVPTFLWYLLWLVGLVAVMTLSYLTFGPIANVLLILPFALIYPGSIAPARLNRTDRNVWRFMRRAEYDRRNHQWIPYSRAQRLVTAIGWVFASFLMSVVVGFGELHLDSKLGIDPDLVDGRWIVTIWSTGLISVLGISLHVLGRQRQQRERAKQSLAAKRESLEHRTRTCHCQSYSSVTSDFAVFYRQQHLQPESDPLSLEIVNQRLRGLGGQMLSSADLAQVQLLRCPNTQTSWLFGPLRADGGILAMQGAPARAHTSS